MASLLTAKACGWWAGLLIRCQKVRANDGGLSERFRFGNIPGYAAFDAAKAMERTWAASRLASFSEAWHWMGPAPR
jgi:hypothetical protein